MVYTPAAFECDEIAPPAKRTIYKLVIDFQTSCLCSVNCRALRCLPPTLLGTHNPHNPHEVMRKGMAHLSAELAGPPLELRPKVLQQWDLFPGMMSSGPFPREEQSSNITQLLEWR